MDLTTLFPSCRQQLSAYRQLTDAGLTRHHLRLAMDAQLVQRVRRCVYSTQPLPPVAGHLLTNGVLDLGYLAFLRAVLLELGKRAVLGGRCAALAWGWDLLVQPDKVEAVVPPGGTTERTDVEFTQLVWQSRVLLPVRQLDPLPVLSATDTVLHCAITLPIREAVAIADSAMRHKTITYQQLAAAVRAHHAKPGYRRMRKVLLWSDPHCGSVLESAFRVLVLEAGIARPNSQYWIGGARVDFCWVVLRIVVEVDGRRFHDPADNRNKDRKRDHLLVSKSWRVLRFTWQEIVHDPEYVLGILNATLAGWMQAA
jgi:very-short-patch-repair endonuclease